MVEDEEYELTPHKQLEELRAEVEKLKKNPFTESGSSKNLLEAMDRLSKSINNLIELFRTASEDVQTREVSEESGMGKKIDQLAEENKKIAEGIVSLAEIMKRSNPPQPPSISPPPFTPKSTPMPPPIAQPTGPPLIPDRKAIFDKFKK